MCRPAIIDFHTVFSPGRTVTYQLDYANYAALRQFVHTSLTPRYRRFVQLREGLAAPQHSMRRDFYGHFCYLPSQGGRMTTVFTTVFYVLLGWLLFNVVFGIALYLRPTRKPSVNPADHRVSGNNSQLSKVSEGSVDEAGVGRSAPGSQQIIKRPALSRILLFGFWLRDGRHSA
jgi:hypothetical protein